MIGWRSWALVAAIVAQLSVLTGELIGAAYPLWFGETVRLRIDPVDPRSLFRGNYVRLGYAIDEIDTEATGPLLALREGERIYVSLATGEDGLAEFAGVSATRPTEGRFIRGRLKRAPMFQGDARVTFQIRYGIEAYFQRPRQARYLERVLRTGGVARVSLASNGKAALQEVELPVVK